jgi:hypothetical protein
MSQVTPTQQHPAPPPRPTPKREGGVDLSTLIITAIASAVAAYTCSKIWEPGTLASAAMTPVLVALAKEALRRPTEVVTTAVPVVVPGLRHRRADAGPDDPTQVVVPPGVGELPEPAIVAMQPQPVTTYHKAGRRLHWRVAVITGLLGFAVCAVAFTVPELLNKGSGTTLFGGGSSKHVTRVVTTTTQTTKVVKPGKTVTTTAPTETTTVPATTATTTTTPADGAAPGTTDAAPVTPVP